MSARNRNLAGRILSSFLVLVFWLVPGRSMASVESSWSTACGGTPDTHCPWTLVNQASVSPSLSGGVLTLSTSSASEMLYYEEAGADLAVPSLWVIEARLRVVSESHPPGDTHRGVSIGFTPTPGLGNFLQIGQNEMYLWSSYGVAGPAAAVTTGDALHDYRIEIAASGEVRVYYDGVLELTGSLLSAANIPQFPDLYWGDRTGNASSVSEWASFKHNGSARECTYAPVWTRLAPPASPSPHYGHNAIYDPQRQRMIVYGGGTATGLSSEVWELSLGDPPAWSLLGTGGAPPAARIDPEAVFDAADNRMLVFGGQTDEYGKSNDLWALTLSGTPTWTRITPAGTPPCPRSEFSMVLDPEGNRLVVFGGRPDGVPLNDVWTLNLSGAPIWTALNPVGSPPPPRFGHTAIYDPTRHQMVVFGGRLPTGNPVDTYYNDTWVLSLGDTPAWTQIDATNPPPIRYGQVATYDPVGDQLVVFGGASGPPDTYHGDAWGLPLGPTSPSWSQLQPAVTEPGGHYDASMILDPVGDRFIVYGGDDPTIRGETWALQLRPCAPVSSYSFFRCVASCTGRLDWPDPDLTAGCSFPAPTGEVFGQGTVWYRAPSYHCTSVAVDLYVNNSFAGTIGPVAPGHESAPIDVSSIIGNQVSANLSLRNVRCEGGEGCCTGSVASWGGTVFLESSSTVPTITFADGTFAESDWQLRVFCPAGNGGRVVATQVVSGGASGPYREIEHTLFSAPPGQESTVASFHWRIGATYDPTAQGAIGSVDYSEQSRNITGGPGEGQGANMALRQDGVVFVGPYFTTPSSSWQLHAFQNLTVDSFMPLQEGGPAHPDFSTSGTPIEFGFLRSNSTAGGGGYTIAGGIDDWTVVVRVDPNPPAAATGLTANLQNCGQAVQLGWTDHSGGACGFEIQARVDGLPSPFTVLRTVAPGTTTHLDTRADGLPYVYRIRALSGVRYSAYSGEARSGFAPFVGAPPVPGSISAKSVGDAQTIRVRVGLPRWTTSWKGIDKVILEVSESPSHSDAYTIPFPVPLDEQAAEFVCPFPGEAGKTYYFRAGFRGTCGTDGPMTEPGDEATPRRAPVVFVHGICGNGADWNIWPDIFAQGGITRWMAVDFTSNDASWMTWRQPLLDKIRHKLDYDWPGDEKVDIVAFSQGGLASRGMIEQLPDGAALVRNLVMLGTPNHGGIGTTLAKWLGYVGPLQWFCQFEGGGAPGLTDLIGGSKALNLLNYGRPTVAGERGKTQDCAQHDPETLDLIPGALGPNDVRYWSVAGTGGIGMDLINSFFQSLGDLTICVSDGVVAANSVRLAAIPSSQRYLDVDLAGVGLLVHAPVFVVPGGSTFFLKSSQLARHVVNILLGSPPAHLSSQAALAGAMGEAAATAEDTTRLVGVFADTVAVSTTMTRSTSLESCDSLTILVASKTPALSLALVTPLGATWTPADTATATGLRYQASAALGYQVFRVLSPAVGTWGLRAETPGASTPVPIISVWGVQGGSYLVRAIADRDSVVAGDSVTVTAILEEFGAPVEAAIEGTLISPSGMIWPCAFRDDGFGGDLVAGDHEYATRVEAPPQDGNWGVVIEAASLPGANGVVRRLTSVELLVDHAPSFAIVPGTFGLSPAELSLGESGQIGAQVLNTGQASEPSLQIELLDRSTGDVLASFQRPVASSETTNVDVPWSPSAGGVHILELRAYSATGFASAWPETLGVLVQSGGLLAVGTPPAPALNFLRQPAPNPFTGMTTMQFSIARAGHVRLGVYDVSGRLVRSLVDGERRAGVQSAVWNGASDAGTRLSAGVYFVRLVAPGIQLTRKAVLIR
jgi:hypothetical protein